MKPGDLITINRDSKMFGPVMIVDLGPTVAGVYAGGPIPDAIDMTEGLYHGHLYRVVEVLSDGRRESWMINFDKSNMVIHAAQ